MEAPDTPAVDAEDNDSLALEEGQVQRFTATWAAPTTVVGALVALLYGLLYLPYGLFYARMGTSPAEVGLSQPEIIGQSIGGLAVVLLVPLWVLGLPTVVLWAVADIWPRFRADFERWRRVSAGLLLAVWVLAVAVALPATSLWQAQAARDGHSPWVTDIALLGLRADAVDLDWIATGPAPTIVDSDSLLFLGANSAELILFDHSTKQLVRLPVGAVVVTADP